MVPARAKLEPLRFARMSLAACASAIAPALNTISHSGQVRFQPMRIACLVAAAVFTLFAYLQLNDLEQYGTRMWLGWVLLYGVTAVVSVVGWQRPLPRHLLLAGAAFTVVGALIRATAIEWDGPLLYNEANPAGNETSGLLIVAAWLALLGWRRSPL